MKKQIFLISIIFIIFLVPITSADTYKLLCLEKGQTLLFSKCNSNILDRKCTASAGCQYCVSVLSGNIYCPADLSICNNQGFACSALNSSEVNPAPINSTPSVALNLTNIFTNPSFPISNNGSQKIISISFKSNVYPLNVIVKLYNTDGSLFQSTQPLSITKLSQSTFNYTIPSQLSDGNHLLTLTGITSQQSTQTINLGTINVKKTISNNPPNNPPINNTNSSSNPNNQQNNNTSTNTNSQETNTNSGSTTNTNNNVIINRNSNSKSSSSDLNNKNTEDTITNTNTENNVLDNSTILKTKKSQITGAAINTLTTTKFTLVLTFIFVIVLIVLYKKSKEYQDPISEFRV